MIKSVFKEIIIILLLILAIILLLGILFYDYMPTSKIIPTKVEEYALDEEVEEDLEKEVNNVNSEEIIKTYVLDATDLEQYERIREYNKGKVNPFSAYATTPSGTSSSGDGSSGGSSGTSSSGSSSSTSSGSFLNTTGK